MGTIKEIKHETRYVSAIVLAPKGTGIRLCVDYRPLNAATVTLHRAVARVDEVVRMLHGKKLFIILDLKSGYHQVLMDEESLELTTFITKFGTFQYVRMPFGLKNAPAYFTMMLEDILVGLVRVSCLIYIDDIIVFGETLPELIDNYVKVLGRLSKANMKVNVLKMQLVCEEVKYLGVMISGDGIAASEEKIEQLDKLHVITNKSELKSLLGLAAYLSPFIPCYAARTKCLSSLLKDKVPFEWGPEQQEAVEGIIDTLKKRTRLAQPDPSAEFHLYTDASCVGVGGVLFQRKGDKEDILEIVSKTLSDVESHISSWVNPSWSTRII
ncbi:Retrovirus-related Pol polyprotein from transposon 297, partial [Aduncisulcus paluster]